MQIQKNSDIELSGFILKKNGLEPVGTPTFSQWEQVGKFIKRSNEAVQFWRGDWLNFGENNYDTWTQYIGKEEAAYQTLANEKWVASRIPASRRRETLSWSHHAEIADLEPAEQDEMLNTAEKYELSVSSFRKLVRQYKIKLDVPELTDEELKKTSEEAFAAVQGWIDMDTSAIESLENLPWQELHRDARDYLLSHLKHVVAYYVGVIKRYDKQKPLPVPVV